VDGDGVDDFIMIDSILQNEASQPPTPMDIQRWAEGNLPLYGINGWRSGNLDFPVVADGDGAIWRQYYPSGSGSLPSNIVIGSDFVLDYFEPGWGGSLTTAIRCCIEKNLCEGLPPTFVFPSTGTSCSTTFDCRVQDGAAMRPVCTD